MGFVLSVWIISLRFGITIATFRVKIRNLLILSYISIYRTYLEYIFIYRCIYIKFMRYIIYVYNFIWAKTLCFIITYGFMLNHCFNNPKIDSFFTSSELMRIKQILSNSILLLKINIMIK